MCFGGGGQPTEAVLQAGLGQACTQLYKAKVLTQLVGTRRVGGEVEVWVGGAVTI